VNCKNYAAVFIIYSIITLSLTIDEEGFPKQSKVWQGNVLEPDTLKDILLGLKKEDGLFSNERTIVMDAGIATEDNIALIKKNVYKHALVKTGICGSLAQEIL